MSADCFHQSGLPVSVRQITQQATYTLADDRQSHIGRNAPGAAGFAANVIAALAIRRLPRLVSRVHHLAEFAIHGGALGEAERLFPAALRPWIDLSTGINPVAYPLADVPRSAWTRLPDAPALARLEDAAARRYGAPAGACVVAAPGTQAIIQRLPALACGRDVRILGPTYSEFERVYGGADARIRIVPSLSALAGADVAILVNPNNPDGRLASPDDLLLLAKQIGTLVVDEAFADALPQEPTQSLIPLLPPSTMVLRSFGKIYGLAGIRLGFAVTTVGLGAALRHMLGPWAVGGPAIEIGTRALADDDWLGSVRDRLRADAGRLASMLAKVGAQPVGSTPLFQLVAHSEAPELFLALAQSGILVRLFKEESSWLRFGLPGCESEWTRLDAALRAFR